MQPAAHPRLLEALLDSWDRNNAIMVNLVRAVPPGVKPCPTYGVV